MRWMKPAQPEMHEIKHVTGFLVLPLTVGRETRWLEWATVEYCWLKRYDNKSNWKAMRFV